MTAAKDTKATEPEKKEETETAPETTVTVGDTQYEVVQEPVTEQRKFFNESAGIHGRGDYGGPYYDDEVNKQWQEKHGEGTWAPSTVVVDEARLKSQYNPHILPGDDARDSNKVDVKPLGTFDVVTDVKETTKPVEKTDDSL